MQANQGNWDFEFWISTKYAVNFITFPVHEIWKMASRILYHRNDSPPISLFLPGQKSITVLLLTGREAGKCTLTQVQEGQEVEFAGHEISQGIHVIKPHMIPIFLPLGFVYRGKSFLFPAPEVLLFKDPPVRDEMSYLLASSPIASITNCYW